MYEILVVFVGGLMGAVLMRWFMMTRVGKWFVALTNPPIKVTMTTVRFRGIPTSQKGE